MRWAIFSHRYEQGHRPISSLRFVERIVELKITKETHHRPRWYCQSQYPPKVWQERIDSYYLLNARIESRCHQEHHNWIVSSSTRSKLIHNLNQAVNIWVPVGGAERKKTIFIKERSGPSTAPRIIDPWPYCLPKLHQRIACLAAYIHRYNTIASSRISWKWKIIGTFTRLGSIRA